MDTKQVVNAICDKLESITMSPRTRKSNEHSDSETDVYKHPNEAKTRWYKYPQHTAEHRFDCESIREADNALDLLVGGIIATVIIDEQKVGRALSAEAFEKKYADSDGVEIDVKSALSKKVADPVATYAAKAKKMTPAQREMLLKQIEAMV